jgi:hypothetical protein
MSRRWVEIIDLAAYRDAIRPRQTGGIDRLATDWNGVPPYWSWKQGLVAKSALGSGDPSSKQ